MLYIWLTYVALWGVSQLRENHHPSVGPGRPEVEPLGEKNGPRVGYLLVTMRVKQGLT